MCNAAVQIGVRWPLRRYFSRRTLEVNLFLVFICMALENPVRRISLSWNYPVTMYLLPHLFTYLYFQLGFFAAVIYCFSDVPFMNEWEMNRLLRMGRKKWMGGHIWAIVANSYLLMGNLLLLTILPVLPVLERNGDWGRLLYTLAARGDDTNTMVWGISYRILLQYTPAQAMALCVLLGGAVISVLGLFMFTVSLWLNRTAALISATVIVALPLIAENFANLYNELKVWYYSPISWVRLDYIEWEFIRGLPGIKYILSALSAIFAVLCGMLFLRAGSVEFQWDHEENSCKPFRKVIWKAGGS